MQDIHIKWDPDSAERAPVIALSFSFFIGSLCFDRAWISVSLYEQTVGVLFQV